MSTYWNIDSGNGNELSAGIQLESEARKAAQRMANERGESVYLYQVGSSDEIESEEIEPVTVRAASTAKRLQTALGEGCYATAYEIDGNRYIVTTGTGDGCFAYDADDVERFLDKLDGAEFDYNDFCQDVSPNAERDLADALATHDVRIMRGGSCMSVLTDAEYSAANSSETVGEVL